MKKSITNLSELEELDKSVLVDLVENLSHDCAILSDDRENGLPFDDETCTSQIDFINNHLKIAQRT